MIQIQKKTFMQSVRCFVQAISGKGYGFRYHIMRNKNHVFVLEELS